MHEDRVLAIKANLPSLSLAGESWISFYGKEKICIDTANKIILEICNLYDDEILKASLRSLKRFTRVSLFASQQKSIIDFRLQILSSFVYDVIRVFLLYIRIICHEINFFCGKQVIKINVKVRTWRNAYINRLLDSHTLLEHDAISSTIFTYATSGNEIFRLLCQWYRWYFPCYWRLATFWYRYCLYI